MSDGIVAPDFTEEAIQILSKKKQNKYIILKANLSLVLNKQDETRTIKGITLMLSLLQLINKNITFDIQTKNNKLDQGAHEDMLLSLIVLKYTQSNSVCFVFQGKAIGIAAGQQSRIDCVRFARSKAEVWFLKNEVTLPFKEHTKYQDKVNATVQYIQQGFSTNEYNLWLQNFTKVPEPLTLEQRQRILDKYDNIIMASDGFFPFRDSIDQASLLHVKYIIQPSGALRQHDVIHACDEYDMLMALIDLRLFLH